MRNGSKSLLEGIWGLIRKLSEAQILGGSGGWSGACSGEDLGFDLEMILIGSGRSEEDLEV